MLKRKPIYAESAEDYEAQEKDRETQKQRLKGLIKANQNRKTKTTSKNLSANQHKKKEAFYGRLFGHNPRAEYKVDYYRNELRSGTASKSSANG